MGRYSQGQDGPLLIVLAGVHGNEKSGVWACQNVIKELYNSPHLFKGQLIGIAGNLAALNQNQRFIDHDLNRQWLHEKVAKIQQTPLKDLALSEDREQKELIELFTMIKSTYPEQEIVLLDLHTTSADGGSFTLVNENPFSLKIATNLEVPVIKGIEKIIKGTTLNYFTEIGLCALGFEAGPHFSEESVAYMEAAIWLTLEKVALLKTKDWTDALQRSRAHLQNRASDLPDVVEFVYRHNINQGDSFKMNPGYRNFQPIKKDEVLASDQHGPVKAKIEGRILMPLYQAQGEDGFFIVNE